MLQGQPPGTVIKCVTAEVTKNQNGACIKLTGLQGSDLTEQQLSLVHQQVKQQLVKKGNASNSLMRIFIHICHANSRNNHLNKFLSFDFAYTAQEQNGNQALGPTKIYLAVQPAQTQLPLTQVSI